MARRKDSLDHESLREKLLALAEAIIIQKGSDALTMRTLAVHMGYSVGHLYNLVSSADEVLLLISHRTIENLLLALKKATKSKKAFFRFESFINAFNESLVDQTRIWAIVLNFLLSPSPALMSERERLYEYFLKAIDEEIYHSLPSKDTEQSLVKFIRSVLVQSGIEHVTFNRKKHPEETTLSAAVLWVILTHNDK